VQAGLRASGEEGAGRVESLLAAGLRRWRWLTGHVAVALAGTGLGEVLGGLGAGVGYGATTGDWTRVGPLTAATVAYLPAVWALVAVTVALYGLVGRWALLGWAALAFCAAVMLFGPLLQLPAWVLDLSPFGHVPMLPVAALSWPALLELLVAVAVLLAVGVVAFRRRDVRTA
jgi:ABC-2 type transport system permease protein